MRATFSGPLNSDRPARRSGLLTRLVPSLSLLIAFLPVSSCGSARAQETAQAPLGIAWQVGGLWRLDPGNAPVLTGDPVPPGSLLHPEGEAGNHSILIFLPDGQRILYKCFAAADCARGFRVPPLYRRPDPFAVNMLARIRAAFARGNLAPAARGGKRALPRDEMVAVLGAQNRVQVAGLAADLPNGRYTYDLMPVDLASPGEFRRALTKTAGSIALSLPGAGLYDLRITDDRNVPRIDLFIAAVHAADSARIARPFQRASALLGDWNIDYQGWPIHEFQWAYLESLMLNLRPRHAAVTVAVKLAGDPAPASDLTAEPAFSPSPGVFAGDTAVTLRCATPGATMHFTVDNSQPLANSPVYAAPIMVKGTELTVKAYATAPGKKDSAVVTGIFRIEDQ
jgi:Chitobiase/beta-hexosaminidase C-terminal domain